MGQETPIPRITAFRAAVLVALAFAFGNVNALIDLVLHPEIPYFDQEHLVVGGTTVLLVAVLSFLLLGFVRELSARGAQLRESEARYRQLMDNTDTGFVIVDDTGIVIKSNEAYQRLAGATGAGDLIGHSVVEWTAPAEQQNNAEAIARCARQGFIQDFETVYERGDGTSAYIALNAYTQVSSEGGKEIVAFCRDITGRKQAEAALATREAEFNEAQRVAHVGSWTRSLKPGAITWSEELYRIFGLDPTLPVPEFPNLAQLYTPESWERLRAAVEQALHTGAPFELRELQVVRPDGKTVWVATHGEVMRDATGQIVGTRGTVLDSTALKCAEAEKVALEARVQQTQALAQLGEMAAVVAHEVRNPLAGVRGAIQIIGGRLRPGASDAPIINEIIVRIDALDRLMQEMLLFARPPHVRAVPVDIMTLVKGTAILLREDPVARHVQVEVEGSTQTVMADATLLNIVLLNLLLNAAHAMDGQGTIRISVITEDHSCRIAVADTGPGIPLEIRADIFTPFFTTKSRGTGLGLPTAKRLIEAHSGRMSVACPPDGGTIVTIELPG